MIMGFLRTAFCLPQAPSEVWYVEQKNVFQADVISWRHIKVYLNTLGPSKLDVTVKLYARITGIHKLCFTINIQVLSI